MAAPILSISSTSGPENGYLYFTVTLSETTDEEVTFEYLGAAGTADAYYDIKNEMKIATVPAGQDSVTIRVTAWGDYLDETDESFWLTAFNAKGATFSNGETTLKTLGTVLDKNGSGSNQAMFVSSPTLVEGNDDGKQARFEVHLSQAAATDLSFTYTTVDGSAKAGSDYVAKSGTITFSAGSQVAFVDVDLTGDSVGEGSEFFSLVVTPTSEIKNGTNGSTGLATILDDDAGGGDLPVLSVLSSKGLESGYLYFQVTLSEPTDEEVTFSYKTVAGTGSVSTDFYNVVKTGVIEAGQTSTVVRVTMGSDSLDEADESVWFEISNPVNAALSGGEKTLTALGIIEDDDGSGSNLSLFVSKPVVTEGDTGSRNAVFEVTLSKPHATDLTLAFTTQDGTAKAGSDYVAKSGSITFLAGQTKATVEVAVKGDHVFETNEAFSLVVTPTSVIKNGTLGSTGVATIFNNDDINEILIGTDLADIIRGYAGDDTLYGRGGHDTLHGDDGKDKLYGEAGKDLLIGGGGADKLTGGADKDVFVYKALSDSKVSSSGCDAIFDFTAGTDDIDLSAIDARSGPGNQTFSFIGTSAFTGAAGELRYEKKASDTYIYADVNGDKKADFAIHLDDAMTLKSSDFVL